MLTNFKTGDWLLLDNKTECQFIHYENKQQTKSTIDINGKWIEVDTFRITEDTKYNRFLGLDTGGICISCGSPERNCIC